MREKINENSIIVSLRHFLASGWYSFALFVGACFFIFIGKEVLGTAVFAVIIATTLIITDDLIPGLEGILTATCFAIRCKYSTGDFLKLWPMAVPIVIFFFSHFYLYPKRLEKSYLSGGIFLTSIAITFGGVGVIYWKTYFSPTSLFYMCMLGFGMLLIYQYFAATFKTSERFDFGDRFSRMMILVILVMFVALFQEYFSRRAEFLETMSVIPFQWRNNAATMLMLAMPFAFYFSVKKYEYIFLGILAYVEIVFTGSRGGLIFGAVELGLCILTVLIIDKKHRKFTFILIAAGVAALFFTKKYLMEILEYTIERFMNPGENSIRIEHFKRGIADFKFNPFNGRGIAYMGNRDIHASAKHTLCWYHCSLIQVPASCGIVGICAYIYLNYRRIKLYISKMSLFSTAMFLSFIGLEMMSLVNPGIFVPFPYLFIVTAYFAAMEKAVHSNDIPSIKKSN